MWSFFVFPANIFSPNQALAQEADGFRAGILVSRHIKPFMDALKGLRESINEPFEIDHSIYALDEHHLENPAILGKELARENYDILVSIGPEATSLAWTVSAETGVPTVHSMVLNPDALADGNFIPGCGISLVIPVADQLHNIGKALPGLERLGILFDPDLNHSFVSQVTKTSFSYGIEIIPLEVSSSRQIPDVLNSSWKLIDALWLIPDQTVISQALVEYIIKEALFQKKPVVGYNRFFYDSGAAVAFAFDFQEIGKQTARIAVNQLRGLPCEDVIPHYEVLINQKVMNRLGLGSLEVTP